MPQTKHVTAPAKGDSLLLVGTMKGAFIFRSRNRKKWEMGGPYFAGSSVYAMAMDGKRIWAGPSSMHFGALLRTSDDFGKTWTNPEEANIKFPEGTDASLKNIWQIQVDADGTMYCGVEPAALFVSKDRGETWKLNEGLWNHPTRPKWQPGGGGLCLHTILPDPKEKKRMAIAVSTAGFFVTDDGGASWKPSNKGVRAEFLPDKYPEFGQCVHKVVQSKKKPKRMFLQNHWGLYRSDDRGASWSDIANGVPSDFGFAMAIHPTDADMAWIIPLEADMFRCTPEGKLRVYRTKNAGKKWDAMTKGLPQQDAYECVVRDAMDADGKGVYFGTRSGQLFSSLNDGRSWNKITTDVLPPIVCVRTAQL